MGLLVGNGSLLLGLHCNAQDSRLYSKGLKRGGFELSGDDAESSVLAAFQLVQSGWRQQELPGLGSVVDNTEMKGPIDLEELVFPPAPPFAGNRSEYSTSVRGLGNHCADMRSEGKGHVDCNFDELG